jgi:hypothetical protein
MQQTPEFLHWFRMVINVYEDVPVVVDASSATFTNYKNGRRLPSQVITSGVIAGFRRRIEPLYRGLSSGIWVA